MTWAFGYKACLTLWQRTVNPPLTSAIWPNKIHPSKPSSLLLTLICPPYFRHLHPPPQQNLFCTWPPCFWQNCYLWYPCPGPNKPNYSKFGMTTQWKPSAGCLKVFNSFTTLISPTNPSKNTWHFTTRLWALLTSPPTTDSFSTNHFFIFWFLFILFFFDQKPLLTNAILPQMIQSDSNSLYFLGRTNLFLPFDYLIGPGLPPELFQRKCSRLSLSSSNSSRGATTGNWGLPYSSQGSRSWGWHFPAILSLVHQWRMWLGCMGYIKSSWG